MKNVKEMSHKELTYRIISNRVTLRTTKDLALKRKLIAENHQMITEIDRRYECGEE